MASDYMLFDSLGGAIFARRNIYGTKVSYLGEHLAQF